MTPGTLTSAGQSDARSTLRTTRITGFSNMTELSVRRGKMLYRISITKYILRICDLMLFGLKMGALWSRSLVRVAWAMGEFLLSGLVTT